MAAALHWLIFPITQSRITFIFFVPAIVLATTIAGRWPGAVVAVIGLINSVAMKSPGMVMVWKSAEQVALISSGLVSLMVILVGDYYRSISRRELSDLHDLHELSATLVSIPKLADQLHLILATFARMHGAPRGLLCMYPARGDALLVAASVGFGPAVKPGSPAAGLAFGRCRRKDRREQQHHRSRREEDSPDAGGGARRIQVVRAWSPGWLARVWR